MSETGWHRASKKFTAQAPDTRSDAEDSGPATPSRSLSGFPGQHAARPAVSPKAVPPKPQTPPTQAVPEPAVAAPLDAVKGSSPAGRLAKTMGARERVIDRSVFSAARGDRWAPRIARRFGRLFTSDSYPEKLMRAAVETQKAVTTGRRIVVLSPRGGSGKTTMAALAGRIFSAVRGDPIAAIDSDPGIGTLHARLGVTEIPSVRNLLAEFENDWPDTFADLTAHLQPARSDLYACACDTADRTKTARLFTVLSRYFPITVIDAGPITDFDSSHAGAGSSHTAAAIGNSHAAIVTVPPSTPGIDAALATEAAWTTDTEADAVPRLYVPVETDARSEVSAAAAAAQLRAHDLAALPLPYDRHLSGGRGIQLGNLAESTRLAATSITSRALSLARGVQ
ncbi:MinD/ParA family ATP-binding protein [Spelaeicoccus albus]|uniref:MinD-like ATPase involved in chromosome partitioning or flagellar assembly n=1 Tax=Spelaeicoccus albus TaxID=1280376 RepID=A0A7Z0A9C1_9MICO|nr:hypothetical protein [Spelaeicoccus albus]NYI66802.1 MinD-like ATPase involved in chromosome partitioning or flagellar assembly [Spelaeicoccus albus]